MKHHNMELKRRSPDEGMFKTLSHPAQVSVIQRIGYFLVKVKMNKTSSRIKFVALFLLLEEDQ